MRFQYVSREYRRIGLKDADMAAMATQGWRPKFETITTSRPGIGFLFGIIGYWAFSRDNVFHVTYEWDVEANGGETTVTY